MLKEGSVQELDHGKISNRSTAMHIAQIVSSIEEEAAGPSYTVPRLAQTLAGLGHEVKLLSLGAPGEFSRGRYTHKRLQQDLAWPRMLAKLGASRNLRQALITSSSDVFHTHGLWMMPNVYPARIARSQGVPFVLSPRGMLSAAALRFSPRLKALFWNTLQGRAVDAVTCFHATSLQERDDIRDFGLKQPIAVIPNGIDVLQNVTKTKILGTKQCYLLLYFGRIHPIKQLDTLIKAWAQLETKFSCWQLRIVGHGESNYVEKLKLKAKSLQLRRCTIEGPVYGSHKYDLYRAAELFVLPSQSENFAMTVAESLASGVPVVTTTGTPWAGLETNRCGWWIEHGVDDLIAALRSAMSLAPGERHAMGTRGKNWMHHDFSWMSVSMRMVDVYRWLRGQGERPNFIH